MQGVNPVLLHWRRILHCLSYQRSPIASSQNAAWCHDLKLMWPLKKPVIARVLGGFRSSWSWHLFPGPFKVKIFTQNLHIRDCKIPCYSLDFLFMFTWYGLFATFSNSVSLKECWRQLRKTSSLILSLWMELIQVCHLSQKGPLLLLVGHTNCDFQFY